MNLLPLKTEQARQFYAQQAALDSWSVRGLHHQIERKGFERTTLASVQAQSLALNIEPANSDTGHWGTGGLELAPSLLADFDAAKSFIATAYEGRAA